MSKNWVNDIRDMHEKNNVDISTFNQKKLYDFLKFRVDFLKEELNELVEDMAYRQPAGIVDALIDLCVVAIGTLDLYKVDGELAWDRVHKANMTKSPGINKNRPNPFGLPDLVKPNNFKDPYHGDNVGLLFKALTNGEK